MDGRRLHRDERGSFTPWIAGLCLVLLGLGGLSWDLWRAFGERRALAGVVDAAAIAGASGIDEQAFRDRDLVVLDPALAEQRAWQNLAAQTDTASLTEAAVSATTAEVTVVVEGRVDLSLTRLLVPDRDALTITVTATSAPRAS